MDKSVRQGKKGKVIVKFSCKNDAVTYDFSIETYPDGGTYVYVIEPTVDGRRESQ